MVTLTASNRPKESLLGSCRFCEMQTREVSRHHNV